MKAEEERNNGSRTSARGPFSLELCAGGGGQALGLEAAGFQPLALVDIDPFSCATLRANRTNWKVIRSDIANFDGRGYTGVDLLAAGLPCPPFSVAGKQLGEADERNLFPQTIRLISEMKPRTVMIENVRGMLDRIFEDHRRYVSKELKKLGYISQWRLFNAADFGVPQYRQRVVLVATQGGVANKFTWPGATAGPPPTVGEVLHDLIASRGWKGAESWRERAKALAPTIVGGSHKHGGPDLGPTRARRAWAALGVDGLGIADEPPDTNFVGIPKLTIRMVARLQGFPDDWRFEGRKTAAYRQVGNAFPPPVAFAVATRLMTAISAISLESVVQPDYLNEFP